ncbi:MAG: hypothetical protein MUC95_09310 [Spirochaetes bacterium]|nr:hypothetical protein [Spirochaetota bacterium]
MKKNIPIIIVFLVLIVAGAYYFMGRSKTAVTLPLEISKKEGQNNETFTGKLMDAVAKGVPFKCTFKNNQTEGTGYIKGKKYYGEISSNGKAGYIVMDDKCMWTWDKDKKQGVKMCFEKSLLDEEANDMQNIQAQTTDGEYNCKAAVFSDSIFIPPSDVKFMDIDQGFGMEEGN